MTHQHHRRHGGHRIEAAAEAMAARVTRWVGSTVGIGAAIAAVLVWAATGPLFAWSNSWQLVINTGTTIVTFLMVFLIQRSQNKDSLAIQLKLNELVAAMQGASNRLIDVEDLSEHELELLHAHFRRLVEMSRADVDLAASHSIEEAESRHAAKRGATHTITRDRRDRVPPAAADRP